MEDSDSDMEDNYEEENLVVNLFDRKKKRVILLENIVISTITSIFIATIPKEPHRMRNSRGDRAGALAFARSWVIIYFIA